MSALDRSYLILQKPVITEKTSGAMADRNAYTFRVPVDANKVEIRQAVQAIFAVNVVAVNTLRVRPRIKRRGYVAGATPAWKKAIVQLKEGQTIDVV
ncbi:MAG: 50S ribosomal protein L23 [Planctomycetaceae bacterium]|nr:50S ribosomal protein L23 [Planctomycetaceae bacterium]